MPMAGKKHMAYFMSSSFHSNIGIGILEYMEKAIIAALMAALLSLDSPRTVPQRYQKMCSSPHIPLHPS